MDSSEQIDPNNIPQKRMLHHMEFKFNFVKRRWIQAI